MTDVGKACAQDPGCLAPLLRTYSIEITARDRASRDAVIEGMPAGSEVFIADLPDQSPDVLLEAAAAVRQAGLAPVPHLVARNIAGRAALGDLLRRLRREAAIDRALVTGGDRSDPVGEFSSGLDLLESGFLERHGISRVALVCYPEGHPRIGAPDLETALERKLAAAGRAGFEVLLVSQFAFDPAPILAFVRRLRGEGVVAPLRVGVAGPAARDTLVEFGVELGVGPSLQALRRRRSEAGNGAALETPESLLAALAQAQGSEPALGMEGTHLFPFGSTPACVSWPREVLGDGAHPG